MTGSALTRWTFYVRAKASRIGGGLGEGLGVQINQQLANAKQMLVLLVCNSPFLCIELTSFLFYASHPGF